MHFLHCLHLPSGSFTSTVPNNSRGLCKATSLKVLGVRFLFFRYLQEQKKKQGSGRAHSRPLCPGAKVMATQEGHSAPWQGAMGTCGPGDQGQEQVRSYRKGPTKAGLTATSWEERECREGRGSARATRASRGSLWGRQCWSSCSCPWCPGPRTGHLPAPPGLSALAGHPSMPPPQECGQDPGTALLQGS